MPRHPAAAAASTFRLAAACPGFRTLPWSPCWLCQGVNHHPAKSTRNAVPLRQRRTPRRATMTNADAPPKWRRLACNRTAPIIASAPCCHVWRRKGRRRATRVIAARSRRAIAIAATALARGSARKRNGGHRRRIDCRRSCFSVLGRRPPRASDPETVAGMKIGNGDQSKRWRGARAFDHR